MLISHITSLAATGELAAQTVLALRPLETSNTAFDLMKHIEQNGGKLFAKNRFFCKCFLVTFKLSVRKTTSLLQGPWVVSKLKVRLKPGDSISLCFGRKSYWTEEVWDALVYPQSQGGWDIWVSWPYGFVRDFLSSSGLSQVHLQEQGDSYRVKGAEQFMD